jgi:hypothetical protein
MEMEFAKTDVSMNEVVDLLRIQGSYDIALNDARRRKITAEEAKRKGIKVTESDVQKAFDMYRIANGLHSAKETKIWLESRGVSIDAIEKFIETNILINRFKDMLISIANPKLAMNKPEILAAIREHEYEEWLGHVMK